MAIPNSDVGEKYCVMYFYQNANADSIIIPVDYVRDELHVIILNDLFNADISTTMDIYAECTKEKKKEVMTNLEGCIIIK